MLALGLENNMIGMFTPNKSFVCLTVCVCVCVRPSIGVDWDGDVASDGLNAR